MTRHLQALCLVLYATATFAGVIEPDDTPPPPNAVRVLVPRFSGGDVGTSVASIISVQIWRTLRLNPSSAAADVTHGEVAFDRPLESQSYEAAAARGQQRKAAIVVWGEASEFGDGVIVQAHLILLDVENRHVFQYWDLHVRSRRHDEMLRFDFPHRAYDFEPILLKKDVVRSFPALRNLPLYRSKDGGEIIGHLGVRPFRALDFAGSSVRVASGDRRGWIHVPQLSQLDNEIASFTAAMVRLLRKDWSGARYLFNGLLTRQTLPESIAIDAQLYRALATYQSFVPRSRYSAYPLGDVYDRHIEPDVLRALERNPYLRSSAALLLMMQAAEARWWPRSEDSPERLRLRASIERYRPLFESNDRLLRAVERLAE